MKTTRRMPARQRRALVIAAEGWLVAGWTAAACPALAQESVQYSYFGSYSVRDAYGGDNGRISSSRGDGPIAQASVGAAGVSLAGALTPVALARADASSGEGGRASGSFSLRYSVRYTPDTSYAALLASGYAASGLSFGTVQGQVVATAQGAARASARLSAEAGGWGAGESPFSDRLRLDCGVVGSIVGPGNDGQCGSRSATLNLHLKLLPGEPSFVGTIELWADVSSGANYGPGGTVGFAHAFVDPLVTLAPQFSGELVIGGGAVANAVPEPGTWALLAAGLAVVGGAARRRRT